MDRACLCRQTGLKLAPSYNLLIINTLKRGPSVFFKFYSINHKAVQQFNNLSSERQIQQSILYENFLHR
jgi:hypothetical protein